MAHVMKHGKKNCIYIYAKISKCEFEALASTACNLIARYDIWIYPSSVLITATLCPIKLPM